MTTDQPRSRSAAYEAARAEFDRLRVEEKALFLVEAAFVTVGRGLEAAGETLAKEMDGLFRTARGAGTPTDTPPAADPMTDPGPMNAGGRRRPSAPGTPSSPDPNVTL